MRNSRWPTGIAGVRSSMTRFLKEHGYKDEIKNENPSKTGYGREVLNAELHEIWRYKCRTKLWLIWKVLNATPTSIPDIENHRIYFKAAWRKHNKVLSRSGPEPRPGKKNGTGAWIQGTNTRGIEKTRRVAERTIHIPQRGFKGQWLG